jgi:hypothetical protein
MAMKRLEFFMHAADGGLPYFIGVVSKFANVLQTTDVKHCVLPDVTLHSTVRCACGDTGVSSTYYAAEKVWQNLRTGALGH